MNYGEGAANKLLASWHRGGVLVNPGASASAIFDFERRWRVLLPSALRTYLLIANGMPPGSTDSNMIRFWPVEEIVPLAEGAPNMIGDDENEYVRALLFADYCLWAHAYAIQPDPPRHVVLIGTARPLDLEMQFEEFVDAYLSRGVVV